MKPDNLTQSSHYSRELAEIEAIDPATISNPARRAWAINVKKNLEDSRGVNREMLELFKDSGAQHFTELPALSIDYEAGLDILCTWMQRIDNADVILTIANLIIPYVNRVNDVQNPQLIDSLVNAFSKVATYDRNPQFLANVLRTFASRLRPDQADILFDLCENKLTKNALRIYLVEGLSKFKDDRANRFLPKLLLDDEFWVVDVAIECCQRLKCRECTPELATLSKSSNSKTRTKASRCILALDRKK